MEIRKKNEYAIHKNWKNLYPKITIEQSLECEKRTSDELNGKYIGSLDCYIGTEILNINKKL